jgi:hypothetical protein
MVSNDGKGGWGTFCGYVECSLRGFCHCNLCFVCIERLTSFECLACINSCSFELRVAWIRFVLSFYIVWIIWMLVWSLPQLEISSLTISNIKCIFERVSLF